MQRDARDDGIAHRQRFGEGFPHERHALAVGRATFTREGQHCRVGVEDLHAHAGKSIRHGRGQRAGAAAEIEHETIGRQMAREQVEMHAAHRVVLVDERADEPVILGDLELEVSLDGMGHAGRLAASGAEASAQTARAGTVDRFSIGNPRGVG